MTTAKDDLRDHGITFSLQITHADGRTEVQRIPIEDVRFVNGKFIFEPSLEGIACVEKHYGPLDEEPVVDSLDPEFLDYLRTVNTDGSE
jgi:hypothetical protein